MKLLTNPLKKFVHNILKDFEKQQQNYYYIISTYFQEPRDLD